jgi:surface polysaccharide O-acyltransferase-like enzyme
MDKDLLKGLAILSAVVVAVTLVFVLGAHSGPQKAECIANALKNGVRHADIDRTCHLSQRAN